jgi:hypothetical protein
LGGAQSFKVVAEGSSSLSREDREAQEQFQRKVARLYRAVSGAIHTGEELETRLKAIRTALHETPTIEKELGATADALAQRNRELLRVLRGDQELAKRNEPVPSSINDRVNSIMEGERFALTKPTQTHLDAYNIAASEFTEALAKLHALVVVDFAKLEKDMEAAGAPWTPGRVPEWSEK